MVDPIPKEAIANTIANSPPTNKIDPAQFKQTHSKRFEEIRFAFAVLLLESSVRWEERRGAP
jgi:hypothetical protein